MSSLESRVQGQQHQHAKQQARLQHAARAGCIDHGSVAPLPPLCALCALCLLRFKPRGCTHLSALVAVALRRGEHTSHVALAVGQMLTSPQPGAASYTAQSNQRLPLQGQQRPL
jgi:hypothetical protein